ncbi:hypothetical protein C8R45DRAFT_1007094 [Mycena sanguinolenta]|nr:hypothetical protein C8R45DRAFT_1007094 [Mycena sanguinolenta]
MHPDLRPAIISTLPIRFATPALNGSLADFQKLMELLKRQPHSNPAIFLPVYYANLDLAGIPTAAGLDPWTTHVSPINRALLSLEGTPRLWAASYRWPDGLLSALWPRIWSWVHFLDVYNEIILPFILLSEVDAYSLYMRSILEILTNSNEVPLPSFPPGLWMLFGRAWRITLPPVPGRNTMAHSDVVRFLGTDTESGWPGNFREYLQGVGTVNDFAALISRHIFHAMPDSTPVYLHFQLSGMLRMLVERNDHSGSLHMALVNHGIVRWIAKIICHYAISAAEQMVELIAMCLTLLQRAFNTFPSYPAVTEALESNRLITLISRYAQRQATQWNHYLQRLFAMVLPRSMLSQCRIDEQRLLPVLDFQDAELTAAWECLNTLAMATISILQAYDSGAKGDAHPLSGAYRVIRACNNMKCGRLCGRNEIKRCLSCHQTNHRSARCQSIDWHIDGRRAICQPLQPLRLAEYALPSERDNSFLRALIHHLHEPPPDPAWSDALAAQWEDQVARMVRSSSRMGIVVVLVAVGTRKVRCMAALRTDTSALNEALTR